MQELQFWNGIWCKTDSGCSYWEIAVFNKADKRRIDVDNIFIPNISVNLLSSSFEMSLYHAQWCNVKSWWSHQDSITPCFHFESITHSHLRCVDNCQVKMLSRSKESGDVHPSNFDQPKLSFLFLNFVQGLGWGTFKAYIFLPRGYIIRQLWD